MSTICDRCGAEGAHPYTVGFGSVVTGDHHLRPPVIVSHDLCPRCAKAASDAIERLGTQLTTDRTRRRAIAEAEASGRITKLAAKL
ncbi:MAG: hypothetical protein AAFR79_12670 [Pseudomonadota bacterium]